jgi:hypothetical protein
VFIECWNWPNRCLILVQFLSDSRIVDGR